MTKFCNDVWLDLGEFGQHKAEVTGVLGRFPHVASITVQVKGETVELVHLMNSAWEQEQLAIQEADYNEYLRDSVVDAKIDEMILKDAA